MNPKHEIGGLDAELFIGREVKITNPENRNHQHPSPGRVIACGPKGARILLPRKGGTVTIPYNDVHPWWSQNADLQEIALKKGLVVKEAPPVRLPAAPPPAGVNSLGSAFDQRPRLHESLTPQPASPPAPAAGVEESRQKRTYTRRAAPQETPMASSTPSKPNTAVHSNIAEPSPGRRIIGVNVDFANDDDITWAQEVSDLKRALKDLAEAESLVASCKQTVDEKIQTVTDKGVTLIWGGA